MAEKVDETKANNVGVTDGIGEDIIKAQKEALVKEIELFEDNLKKVDKTEERFVKQWERDNKLWLIRLKGINKIIPIFEYEKDPEYWVLMQDVVNDQYTQDKFLSESKIKHFEIQRHDIQEELQSSIKKLLELERDE